MFKQKNANRLLLIDFSYVNTKDLSDFSREVEFVKTNVNCTSRFADCTYVKSINKDAESVDDATAGMVIVILLFILPSKLKFWPFVKGQYVYFQFA